MRKAALIFTCLTMVACGGDEQNSPREREREIPAPTPIERRIEDACDGSVLDVEGVITGGGYKVSGNTEYVLVTCVSHDVQRVQLDG